MNELQQKTKSFISNIKKLTSIDLTEDEVNFVSNILEAHEVEPSATAERITEFLNSTSVFRLTHAQIYKLL